MNKSKANSGHCFDCRNGGLKDYTNCLMHVHLGHWQAMELVKNNLANLNCKYYKPFINKYNKLISGLEYRRG